MHNEDRESIADRLSHLFSDAKRAHVTYERDDLKGTDPDWAGWYARYLIDRGVQSLAGWPSSAGTEKEVAALLREADRVHQANAPQDHWPDYYARYILTKDNK